MKYFLILGIVVLLIGCWIASIRTIEVRIIIKGDHVPAPTPTPSYNTTWLEMSDITPYVFPEFLQIK